MPASTDSGARSRLLQRVDIAVHFQIEQFLYSEAEMLDERRFEEWYALFADDLRYRVPTQSNRLRRERGREASTEGEVCLFDDDKTTLGWRVRQQLQATHWAEDPPSRTRHLVTNVRAARADPAENQAGTATQEYRVRSNFLCYRNRLADQVDLWAGERTDVLRADAEGFRIARRTVTLDQNVVLSKNLSVFF